MYARYPRSRTQSSSTDGLPVARYAVYSANIQYHSYEPLSILPGQEQFRHSEAREVRQPTPISFTALSLLRSYRQLFLTLFFTSFIQVIHMQLQSSRAHSFSLGTFYQPTRDLYYH